MMIYFHKLKLLLFYIFLKCVKSNYIYIKSNLPILNVFHHSHTHTHAPNINKINQHSRLKLITANVNWQIGLLLAESRAHAVGKSAKLCKFIRLYFSANIWFEAQPTLLRWQRFTAWFTTCFYYQKNIVSVEESLDREKWLVSSPHLFRLKLKCLRNNFFSLRRPWISFKFARELGKKLIFLEPLFYSTNSTIIASDDYFWQWQENKLNWMRSMM